MTLNSVYTKIRTQRHASHSAGNFEPEKTDAKRSIDPFVVASLKLALYKSITCIIWCRTRVITGATGSGKSWLACALAQYAARKGHTALYQRVPRLGEELRIRHGNGTFGKWLIQLAKTDVLVLDDWGMTGLDAQTRADLLGIIDDRSSSKATVITSQLPTEHWHAWIGDTTIADAMLDRIMQRNHRFILTGDSLRQKPKVQKKEADKDTS